MPRELAFRGFFWSDAVVIAAGNGSYNEESKNVTGNPLAEHLQLKGGRRTMIIVAGSTNPIDVSELPELEAQIYRAKQNSPVVYSYNTVGELRFELELRTQICTAARALNQSGAQFGTFKNSKCNPQYWILTSDGGFLLKGGVQPSTAVRDIFLQGWLYRFECATAIIIVMYKAVLESIPAATFNELFPNLYLHDWNADNDLRLITVKVAPDTFPGDVMYFSNPDYDPETPEWQGENVVKLDEDVYYGHGIGIKSAAGIIAALNGHRTGPNPESAYLLPQATYPDFAYLSQFAGPEYRPDTGHTGLFEGFRPRYITAHIGSKRQVLPAV